MVKKIQTTLNTGDKVLYNGCLATIGTITKGVIKVSVHNSPTSVISLFYSTKQLNKLVASGQISKNN